VNRRLLLLCGLVLVAVVVSSSSTAQIQANGECVQAKTWHLQQAMKLSLQQQQEYHLGAADAADQLSTMGGSPCAGWKDWASGRSGPVEP
jgi:hypothetical protein